MARRKKSRGRRRQKISIAATVGLLAALKMTWEARASTNKMVRLWTGYNVAGNEFNIMGAQALIAAGAGAAASMVAAKVGLNRYVKIPYVKI